MRSCRRRIWKEDFESCEVEGFTFAEERKRNPPPKKGKGIQMCTPPHKVTMEFEHVGKQCQLDSCSQHDFMPIQCEYCRKYFCEEHYTLDNHQCPCLPERNNLPQAEKDEINSRVFQRAMEAIQKVRHESKMRDEQSAATNGGSKSASGAGVGATTTRGGRKKASEILKEKRNQKRQHSPAAEEEATSIDWTQQKPEAKPLTEAARKRKQKVAMMKIKTKASNSREIPEGEKLYFYIKFDSSVGFTSASSIPGYDGKMQQLSICLSKYWTIGRVIDYISAKTEVRNSNNATNDEHDKLRLWNSSEDISLDVHTKLGEAVDSDVVQEGDCLVLKRG